MDAMILAVTRMAKGILFVVLLFFAFETCLMAKVTLPRMFSDRMVLQRDIKIPVFGSASPGEIVTLKFNGKVYTAIAGGNKKWLINLVPQDAGGPYSMYISGTNRIIIKNILIGDVWICSGQSNMQLPMEFVKGKYASDIRESSNPDIRLFLVNRKVSFIPAQDIQSTGWKMANPDNIIDFSAAAYFFARSLYRKEKVPIGLIESCWGGTRAEAWTSRAGLKNFPNYLKQIDSLNDIGRANVILSRAANIKNIWYDKLKTLDKGFVNNKKAWVSTNINANEWQTIRMPSYLGNKKLTNFAGVVWLRKVIDLPSYLSGKEAILLLGNIVDQDSTYLNGKLIGYSTSRYKLRKYKIPGELVRAGENVISVRMLSTGNSPVGGFVANKPYEFLTGDTIINIDGDWKYRISAIANPIPPVNYIQSEPSVLYNGMIAPLIPYAIKGVIWYQGESNTLKPYEYRSLFTSLITDWRTKWKQGCFPFLYVQLANFGSSRDTPSESDWAELREAQSMALSLPNTGMAVTIDIGSWDDIHPLNKSGVGKRLALIAEKLAYHHDSVVYSGPTYHDMKIIKHRVMLMFTNTGGGLVARGGNDLKMFAIAGSNRKFVWAKAKIVGENRIEVWSDKVDRPVAVRYAWADNPAGCNLYNKEGLPASPFRTDQWTSRLSNLK